VLKSRQQDKNPRVSIVVLNWNAWGKTGRCLNSTKNLRYSNYEIIVVDNGSITRPPDYFKDKLTDCQYLETGENLGYTGGNNVGIKHALERGADYVLILNNDAVIKDPDLLRKLVSCFLATTATGIAAPKLTEFRPNGALIGEGHAISRSLQLLSALVKGGHSARPIRLHEGVSTQTLEPGECPSEMISVMSVSGSAMLISRQVFEAIGFLDDRLFMYDDETDFCLRVIEAGWDIVYVRNTSVARETCVTEDMPAYRAYLQGRNRFRLAHKRKTWQLTAAFVFIHMVSCLRIMIVLITYKRLKEAASLLKGVWDGVIGRWGMTPNLRRLLVGASKADSLVLENSRGDFPR
jgi:GT2 family glycosyltransferase